MNKLKKMNKIKNIGLNKNYLEFVPNSSMAIAYNQHISV